MHRYDAANQVLKRCKRGCRSSLDCILFYFMGPVIKVPHLAYADQTNREEQYA